jgi:putative membrane protein
MMRRAAAAAIVLGTMTVPLSAHELASRAAHEWTWQPPVVVPLAVVALLYGAGLIAVWRQAGRGRGVARWRACSFSAGLLTIVIALISPVAWLSEILFSVHMTQHMLLMLVAAPLMMFGQPLLVCLWALRPAQRARVMRAVRTPAATRAWHGMTGALTVFVLQAVALWVWHIPALYEAALDSPSIHALEHLSLLLTASLFWWGMIQGRYGRIAYGLAVVYVFLTAVHSSALGALLTFAPSAWYGGYVRQGAIWHVDPLADQQLAGLLMWIPAGVIFIVFGLALFAAWLGESERRVALGSTDALTRALTDARQAR